MPTAAEYFNEPSAQRGTAAAKGGHAWRLPPLISVGDSTGSISFISPTAPGGPRVLLTYETGSASPVTALASYAVQRNESVMITGHANGEVRTHGVYEVTDPRGRTASVTSVFLSHILPPGLGGADVVSGRREEQPAAAISHALTFKMSGKSSGRRMVAVWDANGWMRVQRDDGSIKVSAHLGSPVLATSVNGDYMVAITHDTAWVLKLSLPGHPHAVLCEGLNGTRMIAAAFDPVRSYRAYALTDRGDALALVAPHTTKPTVCKVSRYAPVGDGQEAATLVAVRGHLLSAQAGSLSTLNITAVLKTPPHAVGASGAADVAASVGVALPPSPMDVGLQKSFKDGLRGCFCSLVCERHEVMRDAGIAPKDQKIDLRMSVIKPLLPAMLLLAWETLDDPAAIKIAAWDKSGISECFESHFQAQACWLFNRGELFPKEGEKEEYEEEESPGPRDDQDDDDEAAERMPQRIRAMQAKPRAAADPAAATATPPVATRMERLAAVGRTLANRPAASVPLLSVAGSSNLVILGFGGTPLGTGAHTGELVLLESALKVPPGMEGGGAKRSWMQGVFMVLMVLVAIFQFYKARNRRAFGGSSGGGGAYNSAAMRRNAQGRFGRDPSSREAAYAAAVSQQDRGHEEAFMGRAMRRAQRMQPPGLRLDTRHDAWQQARRPRTIEEEVEAEEQAQAAARRGNSGGGGGGRAGDGQTAFEEEVEEVNEDEEDGMEEEAQFESEVVGRRRQ
ncbi:hypothetical protein FOA52_008186 [Chlamydomonas sp. UWO 241]|nr:hypothetical protein FOA52_008186 [Chlamydomonas sp. UWO 241]